MPQVTVYIRKEDLPKWEKVEKKSQFIHDALDKRVPTVEEHLIKKVLETPNPVLRVDYDEPHYTPTEDSA